MKVSVSTVKSNRTLPDSPTMNFLHSSFIILSILSGASAFTPNAAKTKSTNSHIGKEIQSTSTTDISREGFISAGAVSTVALLIPTLPLLIPEPAVARGRATLEFAYDRYSPRLEAGGTFYAKDLKNAIAKNDWAAIKAATEDPPKRTKADKSKVDGGIAERAAQAGGFSNARVVTAADLWAASFSDNSISAKTKAMKEQTAILAEVVEKMNTAAKVALGEEKSGGGLFGFGAKAPSQTELAKEVRELYVKGGNAWNQYIFLSNNELPIQLKKLPYL